MWAYFWTLSNSPNKNTPASLIGCSLPLFLINSVYFLTIWAKIVWLIGILSILSICLTNLRHIGHLTLRFLNDGIFTCRISWDKEYRRYAHSESWFLVQLKLNRSLFCKGGIYLYQAVCSQTNRFLCGRGQEDSQPVWRRRLLGFIIFSFNLKYKSNNLEIGIIPNSTED